MPITRATILTLRLEVGAGHYHVTPHNDYYCEVAGINDGFHGTTITAADHDGRDMYQLSDQGRDILHGQSISGGRYICHECLGRLLPDGPGPYTRARLGHEPIKRGLPI